MSKNSAKTVRILAKAIAPYGLFVVEGSHRKIVTATGQAVYWFPGTPSCPYFAQNIARDLVRMGLAPESLKRVKMR